MGSTAEELQSQWANPGDILSLLLLIGGDIVQKAIAQLVGYKVRLPGRLLRDHEIRCSIDTRSKDEGGQAESIRIDIFNLAGTPRKPSASNFHLFEFSRAPTIVGRREDYKDDADADVNVNLDEDLEGLDAISRWAIGKPTQMPQNTDGTPTTASPMPRWLASMFHVLLWARSESMAKAAVQQPNSPNMAPLAIDATDDDSTAAAANFGSDRYGYLDILINNAGISKSPDPTHSPGRTSTPSTTSTSSASLLAMGQIGIAYATTSKYSARQFAVPAYRSSNAALNMITAVDAVLPPKDEGILVTSTSPGYCRTNFSAAEGTVFTVPAAVEGGPGKLYRSIEADDCWVEDFDW
ncbi:hypothetical protein DL765_011245 [Monosporascus sp. GIB2]|nr:hypothetical protein DL765_011245 [Monosporascus sp. GIB2]